MSKGGKKIDAIIEWGQQVSVNSFCYRKCFFIIFLSCFLSLFNSSLVSAGELQAANKQGESLLSWLPLLATSTERFLPNKQCPQNQINDIQVLKEKEKISASVTLINWDLNCQPLNAAQKSSSKTVTLKQKKSQIDEPLAQILANLERLPNSEIEFKSVNLSAAQLNKNFSFNMHLSKKQHKLLISLTNEAMQLTLNVNLATKDFRLNTALQSEKFAQYVKLPEAYRGVKKGLLTLNYSANLNQWETGNFVINSQGGMAHLAENIVLSMTGEINFLNERISLHTMAADLDNVNYALSHDKIWKVPYIKLRIEQAASINLSEQVTVNPLPIQLRIASSTLVTKVERDIKQGARPATHKFPALLAKIKTQGNSHNLNFDWSLSLADTTILGRLNYTPKLITAEINKGRFSAPALINALQGYLPVVQGWSLSKGLVNYQLKAKYDLETETGYLKSVLHGVDIAGQKGDILFDGLVFNSDTDFNVKNTNISIMRGKQQLKLDNLFVGIPVKRMQIDAHSDAGSVVIDNFKTQLLGGEITFENLQMQPANSTKINLSGLQLSEVIKYSAYPAIVSNGILDGVLPLTLTSEGVNIEQGTIFARAPGYIKVPQDGVVKEMSSTNPALSFTLKLLSNFQFDTLQAMIGYTADGEVDVKAEIQGVSPDVSGVQTVKFNYSHQENILKLLESLRFSDQVTRQIQERY